MCGIVLTCVIIMYDNNACYCVKMYDGNVIRKPVIALASIVLNVWYCVLYECMSLW